MTQIILFQMEGMYSGLRSSGHASSGADEEVVCAAISILTQNFLDLILERYGQENIEYEIEDGYLFFRALNDTVYEDDRFKKYFEFVLHAFQMLERDYPGYLKMKQEVLG